MGMSMIRGHAKGKKHLDKVMWRNSSSTVFFTREKETIATPTASASHQARKSQTLLLSVVASACANEAEILWTV